MSLNKMKEDLGKEMFEAMGIKVVDCTRKIEKCKHKDNSYCRGTAPDGIEDWFCNHCKAEDFLRKPTAKKIQILKPTKITIKNCKVVKTKGHDYTLEIKRCISDIFFHLKRGDTLNDAITKAQGSYGYKITLNARRAIYRWANK